MVNRGSLESDGEGGRWIMEDFSSLPDSVKHFMKKLILQNKKLVNQNRELQRKVRELSLLWDYYGIITKTSEVQSFYQILLEQATRISQSEAGVILITDTLKHQLIREAIVGEMEPSLLKWLKEMPIEIERVIKDGQILELIYKEPLLLELQKRDPLIKSALFFPLVFNRECFGIGLVMHRHSKFIPHAIHYADDIHFIGMLAQQGAILTELNRVKANTFQTEKVYLKTIAALTEAIDAKDMYTAGHSQRVAEISTTIAYDMGLSQHEIDIIHYGALLHDIGKIGIPELILNKKGRLTIDEFSAIKKHPVIGTNILRSIDFLDEALHIVRYHHERFDGTGYPEGLAKENIPFMARIVGVADSWDAMTSNRSYRKALPTSVACKELEKHAGTQFDPYIVKILRQGSFAQLMKL